MIPHPNHLLSAELIRDGGSLGASFVDAKGYSQRLMFVVRRRNLSSGYSEREGFEPPVLLDQLTDTVIHLTWSAASTLVRALQPLARVERDRMWLQAMLDVAAAEGAPLADHEALAPSFRLGPAIRLGPSRSLAF